ncbi:PREDICTED: WW domain-binding protein 4 [Ceratosolen solmsi marchali]|uniref:WW domain-binding protein 4 n=1 Tax=Ceratosolen solmsi marchali TaxID=326594 RepID=A0AAJ7DXG2_9HYME|nr:PREDICTED: WW domain-binding protein 4 [Ceratosolen solmsi marchali]
MKLKLRQTDAHSTLALKICLVEGKINWADYWKSQARKYCDFCKCWIADNKPSIEYHENGKKHKENVSKRLREIHKNSSKQAKQQLKFENEMEKMEKAAMAAYLKDIESNDKDMTAHNIINNKKNKIEDNKKKQQVAHNSNHTPAATEVKSRYNESKYFQTYGAADIDPFDPYAKQKLARLAACQAKVEIRRKEIEKNNDKSQGSSKSEKNKNKTTKNNEDETKPLIKRLWYEAKAQGHSYYWNIETNESVWDAPVEGFVSLAEQAEEAKEQEIQEKFLDELEKEKEQERTEMLEEQRANAEREKFKNIRMQISKNDNENSQNMESEEVPYRRDYSVPLKPQPYGSWEVVRKIETPKIDFQLPQVKAPVATVINFEEPSSQKIFKEKAITHLRNSDSDDDGPTLSFKKRKLGNKNVRKRMIDN